MSTEAIAIPYEMAKKKTPKQWDELRKVSTFLVDDYTKMFIIKIDRTKVLPGMSISL